MTFGSRTHQGASANRTHLFLEPRLEWSGDTDSQTAPFYIQTVNLSSLSLLPIPPLAWLPSRLSRNLLSSLHHLSACINIGLDMFLNSLKKGFSKAFLLFSFHSSFLRALQVKASASAPLHRQSTRRGTRNQQICTPHPLT